MKKETMENEQLKDDESTNDGRKATYDFEIILGYIGQMGRYQALISVFMLYVTIPVGMSIMSAVFLLGVPEHRCNIPGIDGNPSYANYSNRYLLNLSTPMTDEGYDGCHMYNYNYTSCFDVEGSNCSKLRSDASTIPCQSYVYSGDVFGETIMSELNLVCGQLIWGTIVNSIYYLGGLLGCLISGNVSDNVGRRYVVLISTLVTLVAGIGCTFAPNLAMLIVLRFVFSFAHCTVFLVGFIYVTEILGDKWRVIVGPACNAVFAVGYALLSPMALYWTNWRRLQLAITVLYAPFALMCIVIPESPRWLFAKGRNDEGKNVSNTMARRNGLKLGLLPDIWTKSLQKDSSSGKDQKYYSIATLFRQRGIREVTLIFMFCYFNVAMVYSGLSLNVGALAGDLYVNNALSGLAEIVGGPISMYTLRRYNRRTSTCASYLVAGIMSISSSIVNVFASDSFYIGIIGTSMALCGKLAISITYNLVYLYLPELYPTVLRATAFTTASTCSLIGNILIPFTLYLQYFHSWLPGVIFGSLSVLSGLVCLRLKETRNRNLMTNLAEAEKFYNA